MVKSFFNPGNHNKMSSIGFLILRITAGAFMLTHGYGKLLQLFSDDPVKFTDPIGIGPLPSLALVVFAEFFCSILLILGFATRFAVIPLIVTMLVAAFITHEGDPFGSKELSLLYSVIYIALALTGAGKFSVDYLICKRS